MPVVQLAVYAKSSTLYGWLYGHTSKFFQLDGLLLFCIIMGLCSASSAIMSILSKCNEMSFFLQSFFSLITPRRYIDFPKYCYKTGSFHSSYSLSGGTH